MWLSRTTACKQLDCQIRDLKKAEHDRYSMKQNKQMQLFEHFPQCFSKAKGLLNVNFMRSALHCQAIHFLRIMGRFVRFEAWAQRCRCVPPAASRYHACAHPSHPAHRSYASVRCKTAAHFPFANSYTNFTVVKCQCINIL